MGVKRDQSKIGKMGGYGDIPGYRSNSDNTRLYLATAGTGIAPVVKWAGGKRKLLPELMATLPERYARVYEPFAGGAALTLALDCTAVLGDANADLVAMYRQVAADPERVVAELQCHAELHSEAHYLAIRQRWNACISARRHAADMIYLNRTCFNGLWRVNLSGQFNVPWGKHATFAPDLDNLRRAAARLAEVELRTGDYRDTVADAGPGDVVYLDPPYDGAGVAYTAIRDDGAAGQAEVAFTARQLRARGCHVLVSNADTPRIRALYAGWEMREVSRAGTISCKGSGRARVGELIIVGRQAASGRDQTAASSMEINANV